MTEGAVFDQALGAFQSGDLARARALAEAGLNQAESPQLLHLVGLIECRLGRVDSGVEWLGKACRKDPSNLGFQVMLARALVDSSRPAEALRATSKPQAPGAAALALWHARAEAADAAGDDPAAAEAWTAYCAGGAGDWQAWSSCASALARVGRWGEAARALDRAVTLNPANLQLRRSLATAHAEAGDHDRAADALKAWVDLAPADPQNRVLVAQLLADLGRDEESTEQLNMAVKSATGREMQADGSGLLAATIASDGTIRLSLLLEIARLLERTNRIDALRRLLDDSESAGIPRSKLAFPAAAVAFRDGDLESARRLIESDSSGTDPGRSHRLKSQIADSLGDPAAAFAEAEAMNGAVADRGRWLDIAARHIESVRSSADSATPHWAERLRPLDPPSRASPVFLVGFPRSGTTLLDTFLMGHPDIAVLEEVPLLREAQRTLGDGGDLWKRPRSDLEAARAAYFEGLDSALPGSSGRLVVDKLPLNMLAPGLIHLLFPDARFIFAQRHPCDCVLSCFMQPFALNESMACFLDLRSAADLYDSAMTLWTRCEDVLPLAVHRLVYEDLVSDPEAALRPLVTFLGLEWRNELLDHRATAQSRGAISTPSYDQVVRPLTKGPVGRWRNYERQLEPVLPVLLPWAERLGYRP